MYNKGYSIILFWIINFTSFIISKPFVQKMCSTRTALIYIFFVFLYSVLLYNNTPWKENGFYFQHFEAIFSLSLYIWQITTHVLFVLDDFYCLSLKAYILDFYNNRTNKKTFTEISMRTYVHNTSFLKSVIHKYRYLE